MRGVSLDELQRNPVGGYVSGECYAHGCIHPALWALVLWGRPTADVARTVGRSLVIELAPPAVPHSSIIDASRLEGGDGGAFRLLEAYLTRYDDELRRSVLRIGLVRSRGIGGAIVAGAFEVAPRPSPVRLFDDALVALRWLHEQQPYAPGPEEALLLLEQMFDTPPLISNLRAVLDGERAPSLETAARSLGLSPRTLQRRLSEAQTTFQNEVADARVRAAQRRLLETDEPVTTIALDVGFPSAQNMSALFKKRTGESPSEWRRKRRRY